MVKTIQARYRCGVIEPLECLDLNEDEEVTVMVISMGPPAKTLKEWLHGAREVRTKLPETSDSVEILNQIRKERASR